MLYVDGYSFLIAVIEFLGSMMCLIALVMDLSQKGKNEVKEVKLVRWILIFSMFSLTSDGVSYLFDQNATSKAILINEVILFIDFFSYLSAFYIMFLFVAYRLPEKSKALMKKLITVLIGVDYIMLFTNFFTGFIYYVDKNNEYFKGAGISVFTGILFVLAILLIVFCHKDMKHLQKGEYLPLIMCMGMLILGGVSEIILDDFPGTNIGICLAVLFAFWVYRTRIINYDGKTNNSYNLLVMYIFIGVTCSIFCTYAINVSAIIRVTKDNAKSNSETVANMINESIANLFIKPITVSETMAQSSNLRGGIMEDAGTDSTSVNGELVEYLSSIRDGMDYQMVFVVSDFTKKFYTYGGISKIVDIDNDSHDIWYKNFVNEGQPYELNVDTDEANDWALSVFVNARVENENHELIAVCGVGVSMEMLGTMITEYEKEYGVKIYLVNSDGLVQVSSKGEEIESLTLDNSYFNEVSGKGFYYENLDVNARLTKYDEALGWYIIVEDDNPDRISVAKIVRPGLITAIISVILLLVAYYGINRHNNKVKKQIEEKEKNEVYLKKISETDELTSLYNRYSFEKDKQALNKDELSDDWLVVVMDVNGLKSVNDKIGHDAGDELIRGAADCIRQAFGAYGKAYRMGGDEFAAIINVSKNNIELVIEQFHNIVSEWSGNKIKELTISIGYVYHSEEVNMDVEELVKVADDRMYQDKAEYYKRSGKDRRLR